jgi:predicted RecA/RadA family phage recombinase
MSITAATASYPANIFQGSPGKTLFESGKSVSSSASNWVQGDFVYLDTGNHILNRVSSTGNAATIMGVADNVVTAGKLAGPYDGLTAVDASQVTPEFTGARYGVVSQPKLKASDAFHPGDKVYLSDGGDTQTVTSSDPGDGNYVGIYVGVTVASAASGQRGFIRVGSRIHTGDVLNFG